MDGASAPVLAPDEHDPRDRRAATLTIPHHPSHEKGDRACAAAHAADQAPADGPDEARSQARGGRPAARASGAGARAAATARARAAAGAPAVTRAHAGTIRPRVDLQRDRGRALPAVAVGHANADADRTGV